MAKKILYSIIVLLSILILCAIFKKPLLVKYHTNRMIHHYDNYRKIKSNKPEAESRYMKESEKCRFHKDILIYRLGAFKEIIIPLVNIRKGPSLEALREKLSKLDEKYNNGLYWSILEMISSCHVILVMPNEIIDRYIDIVYELETGIELGVPWQAFQRVMQYSSQKIKDFSYALFQTVPGENTKYNIEKLVFSKSPNLHRWEDIKAKNGRKKINILDTKDQILWEFEVTDNGTVENVAKIRTNETNNIEACMKLLLPFKFLDFYMQDYEIVSVKKGIPNFKESYLLDFRLKKKQDSIIKLEKYPPRIHVYWGKNGDHAYVKTELFGKDGSLILRNEYKDIQINANLEDSLFTLKVPEGAAIEEKDYSGTEQSLAPGEAPEFNLIGE
jgi:outer membrane lipoprotein-sorting protein